MYRFQHRPIFPLQGHNRRQRQLSFYPRFLGIFSQI